MVSGGHNTDMSSSLTYLSVIYRDSVHIYFLIASLNDIKVLGFDIHNMYITSPPRGKLWTRAVVEIGSVKGKIMLVVIALYGLKFSCAVFRYFLAETLDSIGYRPSYADPDVYMIPAITFYGFK